MNIATSAQGLLPDLLKTSGELKFKLSETLAIMFELSAALAYRAPNFNIPSTATKNPYQACVIKSRAKQKA